MLVTSHICWLKTNFLSMLTTDIQYLTSLCLSRSISQWFPHFPCSLAHQTTPHFPGIRLPLPHSCDSTEVPPWLKLSQQVLTFRKILVSLIAQNPTSLFTTLKPFLSSFSLPSPKHASLAAFVQLFFCLFHSSGRGKDCVYFLKCLIYPINESMNEWMK